MRKFVLLAVLGAVACVSWTDDSEAGWRRRRACYCPCDVSPYYVTAPAVLPPSRMPAKPVLKKEVDNDYHLILATTPDGDGPYMTAEVSALPRTGPPADKSRLASAREQYRVLLQRRMP